MTIDRYSDIEKQTIIADDYYNCYDSLATVAKRHNLSAERVRQIIAMDRARVRKNLDRQADLHREITRLKEIINKLKENKNEV